LAGLAVLEYTHVAGSNALDRAILVEQHLGAGEAGIDLDAQRFGLLAQPAADIAERNDVIALVMEALGQQPVGHLEAVVLGKDEEAVLADRGVERRAVLLPVGQQFVECPRIDDGAGEDVGADLGTFLDLADGNLLFPLRRQLLQAYGGRQPRGAAPDDDNVEFHRFAFHVLLLLLLAR
jgi:hypothetical protein